MSLKLLSTRPETTPNDTTSHPTTPSSYSAAETGRNDDLLNEILLRLPIKSLLKFKSVSKHWLSLISNSKFSSRRSAIPAAASGLFLLTGASNSPNFGFVDFDHPSSAGGPPLTIVNTQSKIKILHSCYGLLLLHGTSNDYYYVYNPTTNQYTTLPRLPFRRRGSVVNDVVLAYDPLKSPHYKVVCVRNCETVSGQYRIEIYSSEGGHWRLSRVPSFSADIAFRTCSGVFWNGAIHWLSTWGTSLYFKVDEEKLYEMPMPRVPPIQDYINLDQSSRVFSYFGESRGHLHLIEKIYEPGATHLNVFEMERDYARWVLKLRVDLDEISNVFPDMIFVLQIPYLKCYLFSVLCVVRGEVFDDSFLVLRIRGGILRYDFKSRTCYKLCDVENLRLFSQWCESYQYIESLACV